MRDVRFSKESFKEFSSWAIENKKTYERLVELIETVRRTPFEGIGKPEALKHDLKGFWSRRIDAEHRLVYSVSKEEIIIFSCKYHY
jgi:toxin YoeB